MLEEMIAAVVKKLFAKEYPHLKLPAVVFAKVDSAKKGSTYTIDDLIIHNDDVGTSFHGHITAYWYEYKLTVLDRFGNVDSKYPALPGVKSKKQFKAGAIVAVALPYGDLLPSIIGEVEL